MQLILSAFLAFSLVVSALGACGTWVSALGPPAGAPLEPRGGWALKPPFRLASVPGAVSMETASSLDQAYRESCSRFLASPPVANHGGNLGPLLEAFESEVTAMQLPHWTYRCAFNETWCSHRLDQLHLAIGCLSAHLGAP